MGLLDTAKEKLFGAAGIGPKPTENLDSRDQSEEDRQLAAWVKRGVEEARSKANRVAHEGIWMTNIANLCGLNSVYFDTRSRQFRPSNTASAVPGRNRMFSNQILPACQNRLARICKNAPRYEVRPEGNTPQDRDEARLNLEVLNDLWERQQINRKRLDLMMWVQACGHSYLKVCYDSTLGEAMIKDPVQDVETHFTGDIRVDIVPAFEFFPDPLARNWDDLAKGWHCKVRPLDYFRVQYGEAGKMVKAEGNWLQSLQYEARINSLNTVGPAASGGLQESAKNSAIEIAYYEKRSSIHPGGRLIIVANGIKLKDDELPCGEVPFVKFDDILVPGKFYPESVITHARPLQEQYNRDLNKGAEWVNACLAGKWVAEKRHGLAKEALNDRTEVIEYNHVPGAAEPHAVTIPQLPSYYFEHSRQMKQDINEIFGLSEVSRGQLPAAGIPAVGMQLLVEQDETRIGIEIEQHEHAYANLGRIMLKYANKFYKTERKLKKRGIGGDFNVTEYTGDDLSEYPDVAVVRGSTIPTSSSLRKQAILNEYDRGLLGNPQDPAVRERVHAALETGSLPEFYKDRALDMAQIAMTIDQIEQGIVPEVNEFDNHALHVEEKNRFRKSDRGQQLAPPLQQLLLDDIERHIQAALKLQNPSLDAQIEDSQASIQALDSQGVAPPMEMGETEGAPPQEQPMEALPQ